MMESDQPGGKTKKYSNVRGEHTIQCDPRKLKAILEIIVIQLKSLECVLNEYFVMKYLLT